MAPSRFERFVTASKALTAFKSRPAARVVSLVQQTWPYGIRPEYFDRSFENYVREGFRKNELVYAAVTATANTAASISLQIHDKGTEKVDNASKVRQLIERPNPMMDEFDLWTTTITHMKLAGVSYWQKIRDGGGRVIQLWPIRPDYVRPMPDAKTGEMIYEIHISGIVVDELRGADVLRFPLPDPLNMFTVLSPIEVLARTADVDNALTDFMKLFMDRGAVPQGILTSKLRLTDEAVEDIRARWEERYGGFTRWTTPAVLDSDAAYQKIGLSFDEMKFDALDGRNETRICMVLQVPPIIIGATMGLMRSTFSNYESARKQWWEDVLMSLYTRIASVINQQLVPEFDDTQVARWDLSKVPALRDDVNAKRTAAQSAWNDGLLTRNEARLEMGKGSVGTEGDVFKVGPGITNEPDNPADDLPDGDSAPVSDGEEGGDNTPMDAPKQGKSALTASESYVLLSLADDPAIVAIQNSLKRDYPAVVWEDAADFHITLVYCTDAPSDMQTIKNVLPTGINPLTFQVGPIGTFDNSPQQPVLLKVSATPQLKALQSGLYASFQTLKLPCSDYSAPDAWQPHITLGYMPAGSPLPRYKGAVSITAKSLKCSVDDGDGFEIIYETKSLTSTNAESTVPPQITGEPLAKDAAVAVEPVTTKEAADIFEVYTELVKAHKNGAKAHA